MCIELSMASVFQSDEFYEELAKRLPEAVQERVQTLRSSKAFQSTQEPEINKSLRNLEREDVFQSWYQYKDILKKFLESNLLRKSEKRLYFFLRDSFRIAGRSTTNPQEIDAVKEIIKSDYLALISDIRFRLLIKALDDNDCLYKFYSVVGDLVNIYGNQDFVRRWNLAIERKKSKDSQSDSEIRVATMMSLASVFSEDLLDAARRIRDSGFFEEYYKPELRDLANGDLYELFFEYFKRDGLGKNIQIMMRAGLLEPALKRVNRNREKYLRAQVEKFDLGSIDSRLAFLGSSGFKIFLNSKFTSDLLKLTKENFLIEFIQILPLFVELSDSKFDKERREVGEYLAFKSMQILQRKMEGKKKEDDSNNCSRNMNKIMLKREEYNMKYRVTLDLQDKLARERLINLLKEPSSIHCPLGEAYTTTEYGWVICPIHGKAAIPHYE